MASEGDILKNMEALMRAFTELKQKEKEKEELRLKEKEKEELRVKEKQNEDCSTNVDDEMSVEDIPESARPFQALSFNKREPLSLKEALSYFDQESKAVTEFPWKPQGGTVVLFKAKTKAHNEDWRANGHRFSQINGGRKVMQGLMKRRVGNIQTSDKEASGNSGFQMISWIHRDKPLLTLVQFVGDENLSVDRPHGKSKNKSSNYVRSAPSLIRDLEVGTEKPFKEYQTHVFNAPPDAGSQKIRAPRNVTQVRNARQRFKKMNKGTDSFNNLNRISLECEDIRFLMTVPDLVMVNITTEMLKQVKEILKIDYDKATQKQLIGYDTQFQLGDFYVSWISIRDIRYQDRKSGKCPVIPVCQIIHERKIQLHHQLAWAVIVDLIPEISSSKFLATSDDEFTPLLEKVRGYP